MPQPDLEALLQRGAAQPEREHDPDRLWQRGLARRRRKRLVAGVAVVLVVAAAVVSVALRSVAPRVPTIAPSPGSGSGPARVHVEQVLEGGFYTEGSFGYLQIHDTDSGELVVEEVFTGDAPAVLDRQLEAGSYRMTSFQRPCEASCPDGDTPGGALDPPTDRCETTFDAATGAVMVATVTVTPGQGCVIDIDTLTAADALQAPCPTSAVSLAADTTGTAAGATSLTVSLTHEGPDTCQVVTGLQLTVTAEDGELLHDIEGNPSTVHIDQQLSPDEAITVAGVWTSWCDGGSAVLEVSTPNFGTISRELPTPRCRDQQPPQLRILDPEGPASTPVEPARVRVNAEVDGAPPFYLDLGLVHLEPDSDTWATHRLSIISEWRTPISVSVADAIVHLSGDNSRVSSDPPLATVLQPSQETTVTIRLLPSADPPRIGTHTATLEVAFWRDQASADPAGDPDGTATINLTYELLSSQEVANIERFCDQAPAAMQQATDTWLASEDGDVRPLLGALGTIDRPSEQLTAPTREQLQTELGTLREKWND